MQEIMRLPAPLSRRKPDVHKNYFGHILILAGSPGMVGASALSALAALRSGAGLVTVGIPKSLNAVLQKKISPVVMTFPLEETAESTLSPRAWQHIQKRLSQFDVIALGPGLSQNKKTQQFIHKIIAGITQPLVIDADAFPALTGHLALLKKNNSIKVLTPHPGEMARLTGLTKDYIQKNRRKVAKDFAIRFNCTLLLKGHRSVVAGAGGTVYVNTTGNPGMATAGSGDVLTGMIAAFLGQGLSPFDAAKYAAYIHGKAGDLAAKEKTKLSMIAVDILEKIPQAIKSLSL